MASATTVSASLNDPVNARILAVSEDRLQGFQPDPLAEIALRSGIDLEEVVGRIRAMLAAGTIRRVRQTLLTTRLAAGALVAWQVGQDRLDAAFDYMYGEDPFSGHVVLRSTDAGLPGAQYRLWTTVKVPQGYSLSKHCAYLSQQTGASDYKLLPARCLFILGVGHVRRRAIEPGEKADGLPDVLPSDVLDLGEAEWRVLEALKREFRSEDIGPGIWAPRAAEAGLSLPEFLAVARSLDERGLVGRFSTFLEHVKPHADGARATQYNGLFHWAVPEGREIEAGREVGRHEILTHAYWRPAGPEFGNVNIMGVAHGLDKDVVLAHKSAIDAHLAACGIPVSYTNVFWGGRSEIKPSEVMPSAYRAWCETQGLDPESMRE